jgi:D-xylose transport system substrate-binding protein
VQLIKGEKPKAETTLYDTPSQLFIPVVVTAKNLKAEIIDKKIQKASELCTGTYVDGCKRLGIQ